MGGFGRPFFLVVIPANTCSPSFRRKPESILIFLFGAFAKTA
jgi:hypothetical protein